ncbi:helix-turn-helix domain-containing protein [Saccharopolyspora sp. NPDC002686]|uniref:winged helix-turn-helix transcriptional regulator n=1 Tax=Saccharopolyspora sp. NPDC002686 TaxID=3154541 RepID=UPI0033166667
MRESVSEMPEYCTVEAAMEVVGGKWKMAILKHLTAGPHRFGELRRALPSVTQRMLTRQLRELEADGIVLRTVYPQVPPKVEYSLTAIGKTLEDVIHRLEEWGAWYRQQDLPRPADPLSRG